MPKCLRCGFTPQADAKVCPKCGAALYSSDVYTALESLSGYYDAEKSAFVHSESVIVFKGETKNEAIDRITKGKIRKGRVFGSLFVLAFAALLLLSIGNYMSAASGPKPVEYSPSIPTGSYVTYEVRTVLPIAESFIEGEEDSKTIYCFVEGTDKTYSLAAIDSETIRKKLSDYSSSSNAYNRENYTRIKGYVTEMGQNEKSKLDSAFTSAGMNFDSSRYIQVDSSSKVTTATILLLLSLLVLGFGFIIWTFGFKKSKIEAEKVKKAFKEGNL